MWSEIADWTDYYNEGAMDLITLVLYPLSIIDTILRIVVSTKTKRHTIGTESDLESSETSTTLI